MMKMFIGSVARTRKHQRRQEHCTNVFMDKSKFFPSTVNRGHWSKQSQTTSVKHAKIQLTSVRPFIFRYPQRNPFSWSTCWKMNIRKKTFIRKASQQFKTRNHEPNEDGGNFRRVATRLTRTYLQNNFDIVSISFTFLVSLKCASTVQQWLC